MKKLFKRIFGRKPKPKPPLTVAELVFHYWYLSPAERTSLWLSVDEVFAILSLSQGDAESFIQMVLGRG